MAELKTKFRASNGLDASGEKIINVATADKTVLSDGVNVDFLIQENTVQPYSETRGYPKGFIVAHNNRLWAAKEIISNPSGTFNEMYWAGLRTDPKWKSVNSGAYLITPGDYITVDTNNGTPVTFTLPSNANDGDTFIVKDIGGMPGLVDVIFKAGTQSIIDKGVQLKETKMTIPYSEWSFVYTNKLWNLYNGAEAPLSKIVKSGIRAQIQSGETIVRQYDTLDPINLRFPKNAANGDIITFAGMDTTIPYYNLELNSFDDNSSIGMPGQRNKKYYRSISGYFVFKSSDSTWYFYDSDITSRLKTVTSDTNINSNEIITVVGNNNTTKQTINLTLPKEVESGDKVTISLAYLRKGQTVNIIANDTDVILTDTNITQFPKRSSYPPNAEWVSSKTLTYNGDTSYSPVISLAYNRTDDVNQWLVIEALPSLERVDPTSDATRARLGVIALADQSTANLDKESMSTIGKEVAITPETLANRTSTETRRGISRIATQAEVNLLSDDNYLDDVFVTPKKLDQKKATETMRGLAEIATQVEVNSGLDDSTIVTPKKLQAKKSTTTSEGIIRLSNTSETVAGTSENSAVSPFNLKNAIQVEPTWEANTSRRGTVKNSEGALTFVGNNTQGSTQALDLYLKTGYAISPYEFNKTLANFLPLKAKAVDSDLLDGLDSSQFIRKDVDQTVTGNITFNGATTTVNNASNLNGLLTLGKSNDGSINTDSIRLSVNSPTNSNKWNQSVNDSTSSSLYKFSYKVGDITTDIFTIDSLGNTSTKLNNTIGKDLLVNGKTTSIGNINTNASYFINDQLAISAANENVLNLSNNTRSTVIKTLDGANLQVQDASNNFYTVLTTKNIATEIGSKYLALSGGTLTGRLNVNAPIVTTISQNNTPIDVVPSNSNFGTWVSDITSSTYYNKLPGYAVPVEEIDPTTGTGTGFVDHYDEIKGPGTLSQFGSSATNGAGTYQIWVPRPSSTNINVDGHHAQSFYMRSWNTSANQWDEFGRIYTTNNPPTSKEIGAVSDSGSVLSSLKIRDFIQIGNLKIYADPATKSVKFDWVEE